MQRHPRTGNIIRGDGELFNEADWLAFQQKTSVLWQTAINGASSISAVVQGVNTDVYRVGIRVPEGRRLFVFSRGLSIGEGSYLIELLDGTFTGGTERMPFCLCDAQTPTMQSRVFTGVTESGPQVAIEQAFREVGDLPGASKPAGASEVSGVTRILTRDKVLRFTRATGGPAYTISLLFIVWEEATG